MSKEQAEQQAQHDGSGQDAAAARGDGLVDGLPPGVHAQLQAVRPGDAQALAELLKMYRESFATQILAAAAPQLGNAVVQRAIKLADQRHLPTIAPGVMGHGGLATGDPGALGTATRQGGEFAPFGSDPELAGTEAHAGQGYAPAVAPAPAPEATPAAAPEAAPAWVASAETYNAAHGHLVDEFNELTRDVCRLDAATQVDVKAVARWQSNHGLPADGKIGPMTVQKAREVSAAKSAPVAAAPQAGGLIPV